MPINVTCPSCGQAYNVPDDKAGKKFRCKGCQEVVAIPAGRSRAPAAEADPFAGLPSAPPPSSSSRRRSRDEDLEDEDEDLDDDYDSPRSSRRGSRSGGGGSRSRGGRRRSGGGQLAGLGKRFLGALIDGLAGMLCIGPGYVMLIVAGENNDEASAMIGLVLLMLGGLALLVGQIFLMATRSQSLGKFVVGIQVHDYDSRSPASFVQVFLLRSFVNGLIGSVCGVYSIIDILFIFSDEHRCLHDKLANTYVVDIS